MNCLQRFASKTGQIAVLIDPDKTRNTEYLRGLVRLSEIAMIDYFFVGGSTVSRDDLNVVISRLKKLSSIPVVIFPGAAHQISPSADALLFLSLVSGRNPDYLIGHHVICAEEVFASNLEVIPTSYLLIDGGKITSVAYVSQTTPIPPGNKSIVRSTAIAGHLLGHKVTYLDAGSGALNAVPQELIAEIRSTLEETVIIVGGGVRSLDDVSLLKDAGANVIVIGNHLEENPDFLLDLRSFKSELRTKASDPNL